MGEKFMVWDELNASEEEAREIEADDPYDAAIEYAERDEDGHADGLYSSHDDSIVIRDLARDGHPIMVRCPNGTIRRFHVGVTEVLPVYGAKEMGGGRG